MKKMPSRLHQTDLRNLSIQSNSMNWIHESRWSNDEHKFFATETTEIFSQFDKFFKIPRPKKKTTSISCDCWVLANQDQTSPSSGWARHESVSRSHYKTGFLRHSFVENDGQFQSLALLITAIFLISGDDRIFLRSPRAGLFLESKLAGISQSYRIKSLPVKSFWLTETAGLVGLELLELDRAKWLEFADQLKLTNQLRHLRLRIGAHKGPEGSTLFSGKKKRGLVARLLRPRIDDSIF